MEVLRKAPDPIFDSNLIPEFSEKPDDDDDKKTDEDDKNEETEDERMHLLVFYSDSSKSIKSHARKEFSGNTALRNRGGHNLIRGIASATAEYVGSSHPQPRSGKDRTQDRLVSKGQRQLFLFF